MKYQQYKIKQTIEAKHSILDAFINRVKIFRFPDLELQVIVRVFWNTL